MKTWKPDTCKCIANIETFKLIKACSQHITYEQCLKTNQTFNLKHGNNPTDKQIQEISKLKEINKNETH